MAKRLAAERNTSVSAMYSRFIRTLAHGEGKDRPTRPRQEGRADGWSARQLRVVATDVYAGTSTPIDVLAKCELF